MGEPVVTFKQRSSIHAAAMQCTKLCMCPHPRTPAPTPAHPHNLILVPMTMAWLLVSDGLVCRHLLVAGDFHAQSPGIKQNGILYILYINK